MFARNTADRHTADRHTSVGHLNFIGSHILDAERVGLIALQALGQVISSLSPILHWRLGPELRQEGRPGQ